MASVSGKTSRILLSPMVCLASRAFSMALSVVHIYAPDRHRIATLSHIYLGSCWANRVSPVHVSCTSLCPYVPRGLAAASVFSCFLVQQLVDPLQSPRQRC